MDIVFRNNLWYAKQFHIVTPEPEPTASEIKTQEKEWIELGNDY